MNKLLTAIALTIARPAVAHAQAAPAPAPKEEKCDCCKHMAKMDHAKHKKDGADAHAGHDKPAADSHQNHQR
jgi:uncharacterized protein involved in copper resistance